MPWKIANRNGKFCVIKESDGSVEKCHDTKPEAQAHMKALYASEKLEAMGIEKYEGVGPALMAVAITSKPHLRQRGKEVKLVERDGQELVEVPLMRKGVYAHPWFGKLVFNNKFFDRMIENFEARVTDYPIGLDFRHTDEKGTIAFLDPDDEGFMERKGNWLYAYGPPNGDNAREIIKSRKWRFSSPEFHPDYRSNLLHKLSDGRQSSITLEEFTEVSMEEDMPNKTIQFGDVSVQLEQNEAGFVLTEKAVESLEGLAATLEALDAARVDAERASAEAAAKAVSLEERIAELEKEDEPPPEDMPEAIRVKFEALEAQNRLLEQETARLREQRLREQVALTIDTARGATHDGYGYTKPLLDLAQAGLLLENFSGKSGETVKLEQGQRSSAEAVTGYFRNLIAQMLNVGLERVPVEPKTEPDEVRLEYGGSGGRSYSQADLDAALKDYHDKFS